MTPPQLDVENPIEVSLIRLMQGQSAPPPLTFPDVSHGYVPSRGLFLSAIVHELIIVAIFLVSFTLSRTHLPGSRAFNDTIKLSDAKAMVIAERGRELPAKLRRRRRRAAARAGRIPDRSRFFLIR